MLNTGIHFLLIFKKANEYLDIPKVLRAKVKLMAQMVRQAKLCCAYTGAGLSRSSGIPDYATKASNSVVGQAPKLNSNLDALPTFAHCALTAMERAGYLHHYVQQNHDGYCVTLSFSKFQFICHTFIVPKFIVFIIYFKDCLKKVDSHNTRLMKSMGLGTILAIQLYSSVEV